MTHPMTRRDHDGDCLVDPDLQEGVSVTGSGWGARPFPWGGRCVGR